MRFYISASIQPSDANLLVTDGTYEVWEPLSYDGCLKVAMEGGKKAGWVVASMRGDYWYNHFAEKGPMYCIINTADPREKYLLQFETNNFCDCGDRNLGIDAFYDFCSDHPAIAEYFGVDEVEACDSIESCGDIHASKDIDAKTALSQYDPIRKMLGEKEWYAIEDYLINGEGKYTLKDILYDEDAWDDYCDWKMNKYHQKAFTASTRIKARRYLK